jgi:hypothetical protein
MRISTAELASKIDGEFLKKYKSFSDFPGSDLWNECIKAAGDASLLNNIIFCNDIHELPPALTFLRVLNPAGDLSEFDKRAVGAFWGFIFKFVFGYRNQRSASTQRNLLAREKKIIKSATYFYDVDEKITVTSPH